MSLPWRSALITGASSGLGEALAERLAQGGVEVVLAARRVNKLQDLVKRIKTKGYKARVLPADVTRPDDTVHAIRRIDEIVGGLDMVVANAGLGFPQPVKTLTWENASELFATNFMGAMATLTAVLPRMIARDRGHLVGMSSAIVYSSMPGAAAYRATKSGLTAFLDNIRSELSATNVKATAIHPAFVETPLADNLRRASFRAEKRLHDVMTAREAAELIVRRLPGAPARIDFPRMTVMMIRLMGALSTNAADALEERTTVVSI